MKESMQVRTESHLVLCKVYILSHTLDPSVLFYWKVDSQYGVISISAIEQETTFLRTG